VRGGPTSRRWWTLATYPMLARASVVPIQATNRAMTTPISIHRLEAARLLMGRLIKVNNASRRRSSSCTPTRSWRCPFNRASEENRNGFREPALSLRAATSYGSRPPGRDVAPRSAVGLVLEAGAASVVHASRWHTCSRVVRLRYGDTASAISASILSCRRPRMVIRAPARKVGYPQAPTPST
jgi:hypothetical protein